LSRTSNSRIYLTLIKWRRNSWHEGADTPHRRTTAKKYTAADSAPVNGYAMVVDGHFKTQFAEQSVAKQAAKELLANYPMLKIEIYDAAAKVRTLIK